MCLIQETKLEEVSQKLIECIGGPFQLEWVDQPAVGRAGGMLIVWKFGILKKTSCFTGDGFVGVCADRGPQ